MTRLILLCSLFLIFSATYAQDCKGYYYLRNGSIEMTMYDQKQKENGKLVSVVSGAATSNGVMSASIQSEVFSEKGKSISRSTGSYQCKNGVMYVDARISMPSNPQVTETTVKAENNYIEYPSSLTEGMSLKDVHFTLDLGNASAVSSVEYDQTDRKVLGKESITTPAGTWDCFKISYTAAMKTKMGAIGIPMKFQGTEWFAPGFGVVKTETKNKNGKLMGTSLITKVSN